MISLSFAIIDVSLSFRMVESFDARVRLEGVQCVETSLMLFQQGEPVQVCIDVATFVSAVSIQAPGLSGYEFSARFRQKTTSLRVGNDELLLKSAVFESGVNCLWFASWNNFENGFPRCDVAYVRVCGSNRTVEQTNECAAASTGDLDVSSFKAEVALPFWVKVVVPLSGAFQIRGSGADDFWVTMWRSCTDAEPLNAPVFPLVASGLVPRSKVLLKFEAVGGWPLMMNISFLQGRKDDT